MDHLLAFGLAQEPVYLNTRMLNRHGAICGATGTGKTVSLKVITEALISKGIPVFLADIKGDLASLIEAGDPRGPVVERAQKLGLQDFETRAFEADFYDVFGQKGLPMRTSVSEMGPILLAELLGLNAVQEGILNICFRLADDNGWLLIDLKDLRAMLNYVNDKRADLQKDYGNISAASVGAVMRSLLVLENQGAADFFGQPSFEIGDLLGQTPSGQGRLSILAADALFQKPQLYAIYMLWLLSELYEELPEVGDLDQPKIVFFFDEAHLLFDAEFKALQDKIEQVIRLIRSKGVGVFFVTQSPKDLPDVIAAQLGNRIQHGLRAYTPKEQKDVKSVAETFRQEEGQDLFQTLLSLETGTAIVSLLDQKGAPGYAQVARIYPPASKMGTVDEGARMRAVNRSAFYDKYMEAVDPESAYEYLEDLQAQREKMLLTQAQDQEAEKAAKAAEKDRIAAEKEKARLEREEERRKKNDPLRQITRSIVHSASREVGRQITRGLLGIFKR